MLEPKDITVLVVDDEEALREAVSYDLKKKGFKVLDAPNGKEAFQIIESVSNIDVVVTDVRMPEMDGVQLLDAIRKRDPLTPAVMLVTGYSDITIVEAYDRGASAMFPKPFDRKAMIESLIRSATSRDVRWSFPRTERVSTELKIEIKFKNFEQAIESKLINLGQGGLFVAWDRPLPQVSDEFEFQIKFDNGRPRTISGAAVVRWARPKEGTQGPKGFGAEFTFINEDCRKETIELVNTLKTRSFIPIH